MAGSNSRLVVFVHGWSVTNTDTYGEFPARLQREAQRSLGLDLDIENIWLGKYVSFADTVRVEDLARGFHAAVKKQLGSRLRRGQRFICITHSTGGPVVRAWWENNFAPDKRGRDCPMSHLIMLAPANFGSALAQLGKGRLGQLKSWVGGVEPGTGVLDWLELGSDEAWDLNRRWMKYPDFTTARGGVFPFVLTGQMIDRKLYDHVNSYTGEEGSDGVVRVAAANLNASYVQLKQKAPTRRQLKPIENLEKAGDTRGAVELLENLSLDLERVASDSAPATAFGLVKGMSHSGDDMGIMRSVTAGRRAHATVTAVLRCMRVSSSSGYATARRELAAQTDRVMRSERKEVDEGFLWNSYYFHDAYSMVIFRLQDDQGHPIANFDLKLLGPDDTADTLPPGFLEDRQRNSRHPGTVTLFLNHAKMVGAPAIKHGRKTVRDRFPGIEKLGLEIFPRPRSGYVHYTKALLRPTMATLRAFLQPNQTTMVDITLRRFVRRGVFALTKNREPEDFKEQPMGDLLN